MSEIKLYDLVCQKEGCSNTFRVSDTAVRHFCCLLCRHDGNLRSYRGWFFARDFSAKTIIKILSEHTRKSRAFPMRDDVGL